MIVRYDEHVCAWCRHLLDEEGNRLLHLSDRQYETLSADTNISHGCCRACRDKMKDEVANLKRLPAAQVDDAPTSPRQTTQGRQPAACNL
jgi:hypothetical protein